jgi:hypothetical protein
MDREQPPVTDGQVLTLAARLRASTAPADEDVGQLFLACGRVVQDGELFLLLARPGRRLLLRQPAYLRTMPSCGQLTFEADLTLRVVEKAPTREGAARHGS